VRTRDLVRHRRPSDVPAPGAVARLPHPVHVPAGRRALPKAGPVWLDIAWVIFVLLNLAAMRFLTDWQTVPFLAIWVSLTAIYGFRLWRLQPTILTLAAVTLATGGIIGVQVLKGQQDADYLAEVPLIALMFAVMIWHGRRRLSAIQERLVALEQVQRISQDNLRLVEHQRRFLQDAAHELGTPITVALGHAELIEQAATDQRVAEDARVVTDELARLRRLTNRLLLLASAGSPDFLQKAPVAVDSVVLDAVHRWGHVPRRWRLGEVAEATVQADRDRLVVALDALLENAVAHTGTQDRIEISVRLGQKHAVFAVKDSGCGIPAEHQDRIFGRFARASPYRNREAGGFGLGLPIVQAIAEAHHGSVAMRSASGDGSVFEIWIPRTLMPESASTEGGPQTTTPAPWHRTWHRLRAAVTQ
jgi:two-component system, OmpR family, sensor kinase